MRFALPATCVGAGVRVVCKGRGPAGEQHASNGTPWRGRMAPRKRVPDGMCASIPTYSAGSEGRRQTQTQTQTQAHRQRASTFQSEQRAMRPFPRVQEEKHAALRCNGANCTSRGGMAIGPKRRVETRDSYGVIEVGRQRASRGQCRRPVSPGRLLFFYQATFSVAEQLLGTEPGKPDRVRGKIKKRGRRAKHLSGDHTALRGREILRPRLPTTVFPARSAPRPTGTAVVASLPPFFSSWVPCLCDCLAVCRLYCLPRSGHPDGFPPSFPSVM